MSKQYGIQARLKVGGSVKDISGFTLEVPTGALGARLTALLADFTPGLDTSQPVKFEIGITKGGVTEFATLLDDARITDKSKTTRLGGDATQITAVSRLADKWKLTPRQPIVLYDPDQVDMVTETSQGRNDVVDAAGLAIEPVYTPVASLDLYQLLHFIYVEKLGFGQVITNIPNYALERAEFGLTTPYHSVAAGQVALFEPQYSSEDASMLFIIDPQGTLPDGFPATVRSVSMNAYVELQRQKQTAPLINAVLLSYKDSTASSSGAITDRVDPETQEVGTFGEADWQRTVINRFVKEFRDDPNDSSRVTREVIWKVESRTSAKADGIVREIAIETQTDLYDYDWQLKTGYTKIVQRYTKLPGQSALMRQVQTETNRIIYTGSMSNPSELVKTWELTEINGTILVDGDEDDEENPPVKTSLYEADRTNGISDEAEAQLARPIKSVIERWREVGSDQIEVGYQVVDHLTNKVEQNKTVQHTGTIRVRLNQGNQTTVTMLLRDEESEAVDGTLPPAQISAGDIGFGPALEIGNRLLARHGQQPQRVTIQFAGIDVLLRRGSLRRVSERDGSEYLVFITGYTITGQNLGTADFSITQQAEGIVLAEL